MTVVPLELLPYRRELSIVLKISKRIMPVSGHRDLFAGKPPAVLQPALTDHRFQPGHPQIGAQSKVVLPRPYENHIPFLINQAIFHENSLAAKCSTLACLTARKFYDTLASFRQRLSGPFPPCPQSQSCPRRVPVDRFPCG